MRYDVEKPEHILEHSIQQVKKTTQHLTGQMEGLNSLEVNVAGTMGCTITVLYIVNEHTQGYRVTSPPVSSDSSFPASFVSDDAS